jgi:hypothetical protein
LKNSVFGDESKFARPWARRSKKDMGGHRYLGKNLRHHRILRGAPRTIEKSGFAPERETRRVKQTANYYRHLGNPKEYKLPSNPPTLYDAGMFAFDLMKGWTAKQISEGE